MQLKDLSVEKTTEMMEMVGEFSDFLTEETGEEFDVVVLIHKRHTRGEGCSGVSTLTIADIGVTVSILETAFTRAIDFIAQHLPQKGSTIN